MPTNYKYKTSKGRQHDARAASFKRIAKDIRKLAKNCGDYDLKWHLKELGKILDKEATLLRSMR